MYLGWHVLVHEMRRQVGGRETEGGHACRYRVSSCWMAGREAGLASRDLERMAMTEGAGGGRTE